MFRLLLTAALLATAYATCEELKINYVLPPPAARATMDVSICPDENTIASTMSGTDEFVAVQILEDYDSGYAATRVEKQNSCFVQKLEYTSLEQHASILRQTPNVQINSRVDLVTTPVDDLSEFGDRLAQFCGDLPAIKIGGDTNSRTLTISSNAITSTNKISCVLILFVPFCTIAASSG